MPEGYAAKCFQSVRGLGGCTGRRERAAAPGIGYRAGERIVQAAGIPRRVKVRSRPIVGRHGHGRSVNRGECAKSPQLRCGCL